MPCNHSTPDGPIPSSPQQTTHRDHLHQIPEYELFLGQFKDRRGVWVLPEYIVMTGDAQSALMLAQIVYWHLPQRIGVPRMFVEHDGGLWIAKKYSDWYMEIGLNERRARASMAVLRKADLISVRVWKFNGFPTQHIKINPVAFSRAWVDAVKTMNPL